MTTETLKKKRESNRKYYQENKEKMRGFYREDYKKNIKAREKRRKEYNKNNKEKIRIWNKISYELKKRGVKLAECSMCGSKENLINHHEDYLKPYDIIVLCKDCHNKLHHSKDFSPLSNAEVINQKVVPSSDKIEDTSKKGYPTYKPKQDNIIDMNMPKGEINIKPLTEDNHNPNKQAVDLCRETIKDNHDKVCDRFYLCSECSKKDKFFEDWDKVINPACSKEVGE